MDLFTSAIHFIKESSLLGIRTFAVLGLLAGIGAWPVFTLLPRNAALRWPLYAPLSGLVVVTLAGLPLVLLGGGVGSWAMPLAVICVTAGAAAVRKRLVTVQGRRLLFSYVRRRLWVFLLLLSVPVLISTFLVTGSHGGSVSDVWGSGDYGVYWTVADYLYSNGADSGSYAAQDVFHNTIIVDMLGEYSRLGDIVAISFLGTLLAPGNINHVIIPLLAAVIILMLGLVRHWFEREKFGTYFLLLPFLCYPFLYFLLYFSYCSQATGVVLFIAALLVFDERRLAARNRSSLAATLCSGIFAGAALLHYPSMLPAAVVFATVVACTEVKAHTLLHTLIWSVMTLLICGYSLPIILFELTQVNARIPGWDWRSLIGPFEFLGMRSVLGYDLPNPVNAGLRLADYVTGPVLLAALFSGVRSSRLRAAALTLVITTGLLTSVTCIKLYQHVPHASHALVKIVSTFAPWLLVIMLLPAGRLMINRRTVPGYVLPVTAGVLVAGQLFVILGGSLQRPWYSDDLISLSRRQTGKGYIISFSPELHWYMSIPIVRDGRRLLQGSSPTQEAVPSGVPLVVLKESSSLTHSDTAKIIDREGGYVAIRNGMTH